MHFQLTSTYSRPRHPLTPRCTSEENADHSKAQQRPERHATPFEIPGRGCHRYDTSNCYHPPSIAKKIPASLADPPKICTKKPRIIFPAPLSVIFYSELISFWQILIMDISNKNAAFRLTLSISSGGCETY